MKNYKSFKDCISSIDWYNLFWVTGITNYYNKQELEDSKLFKITEEYEKLAYINIKDLYHNIHHEYIEDIDDYNVYCARIHDVTIFQCQNQTFKIGLYVTVETEYYDGDEETDELFCGYWDGIKWARNHYS